MLRSLLFKVGTLLVFFATAGHILTQQLGTGQIGGCRETEKKKKKTDTKTQRSWAQAGELGFLMGKSPGPRNSVCLLYQVEKRCYYCIQLKNEAGLLQINKESGLQYTAGSNIQV